MNNETTAVPDAGRKVLIVYYSHSGNTRALAGLIQQQTGGELLEIEPVAPYPSDYDAVVAQAKQELQAGYRPPLKTDVAKLAAYDVILVGSPNWWNTLAPPLHTWLSEHDLAGKTIVPFITHEGTALGHSARDIARLCPQATVREGLAVRGERARTSQSGVAEWLRRTAIA